MYTCARTISSSCTYYSRNYDFFFFCTYVYVCTCMYVRIYVYIPHFAKFDYPLRLFSSLSISLDFSRFLSRMKNCSAVTLRASRTHLHCFSSLLFPPLTGFFSLPSFVSSANILCFLICCCLSLLNEYPCS